MVEISLDHGHCLHHDASTTHDFGKLCRLITKIEILIEKWRSLFSPYFWNLPPRKNPAKFLPAKWLPASFPRFSTTSLFYNIDIVSLYIESLYIVSLNHCIIYQSVEVSQKIFSLCRIYPSLNFLCLSGVGPHIG